jgi:hypothetical protein
MSQSPVDEFKKRTVELIEVLGLSHCEVIGLALSLAAAHAKTAGLASNMLHTVLDQSCSEVGAVAGIVAPDIRLEVKAQIADTFRAAEAQGNSGWAAVESAFPGIPAEVVAEAWLIVSDEDTAAWWSSVERTIDGELVRTAVAAAGRSS